jgi:hypothetical protein
MSHNPPEQDQPLGPNERPSQSIDRTAQDPQRPGETVRPATSQDTPGEGQPWEEARDPGTGPTPSPSDAYSPRRPEGGPPMGDVEGGGTQGDEGGGGAL